MVITNIKTLSVTKNTPVHQLFRGEYMRPTRLMPSSLQRASSGALMLPSPDADALACGPCNANPCETAT